MVDSGSYSQQPRLPINPPVTAGLGGLLDIVTLLPKLAALLAKEIDAIPFEDIGTISSQIKGLEDKFATKGIVEPLLANTLGLSQDVIDKAEAQDAIDTLGKLTSDVIDLTAGAAGLSALVKLVLGKHAGNAPEIIANLPSELGLNYFIGGVLHDLVLIAVLRPLEEAINLQHRPARIDFRTLRLMLKQHIIASEAEFRDLLAKQGYPDDIIGKLVQLRDQQLTPGEITSALKAGGITEGDALDRLEQSGYSSSDAQILISSAHHANSSAIDRYRSVARTQFGEGHISEAQFKQILAATGVTGTDIALEIAAGQLEHHAKVSSVTLSELRKLFEDGDLSRDNVLSRLTEHGYSVDDANLVITNWEHEAGTANKGISEQRILSYMMSGVLSKDAAYKMLLSRGLRPEDANLLVNNPEVHGSAHAYTLSPGLIQQAVKEGVLSVDTALVQLSDLHVDTKTANLLLQVATAQSLRNHRRKQGTHILTEGEIKAAFENGLIGPADAHNRLTIAGYSDSDAALVAATWYAAANNKIPDGWVTTA